MEQSSVIQSVIPLTPTLDARMHQTRRGSSVTSEQCTDNKHMYSITDVRLSDLPVLVKMFQYRSGGCRLRLDRRRGGSGAGEVETLGCRFC